MTLTKSAAFAVGLFGAGLLISHGADAEATVVNVGSASIRLVAPEGYADCSDNNNPVRNLAEQFCPPNNRLLGVFASEEFRHAALAGDASPGFDYALVETLRNVIWRDVSLADFAEIKASIKSEQNTLLAKVEPDVKEAINRLNRSLQEITGENVSVNLDQPVSLGVYEECDRHISMMMLMWMQVRAGGKIQSNQVAASLSLLRLRGKVVFV